MVKQNRCIFAIFMHKRVWNWLLALIEKFIKSMDIVWKIQKK